METIRTESLLMATPVDIIVAILAILDTPTLLRLQRVCKRLCSIIQDTCEPAYGADPLHREYIPMHFRIFVCEKLKLKYGYKDGETEIDTP